MHGTGMARFSIVATRLLEMRERADLSQTELGVAAGMPVGHCGIQICQYETGTHMPDFSLMIRLARVLKAPVPYFYCEDPQLADLILKFGTLGSAQRSRLLSLMAVLVETPPMSAHQGIDRPA
jgi:transcriptional regulator with XRE-family HTH domain